MPDSRLHSLFKFTLWVLVSFAVLAFLLVLWLRWEFSRVEQAGAGVDQWLQVPVAQLDPSLAPPAPCAQQYPLKRAWFGGLHVHTSASFDATAFGSTNTADDAYRFARGEPVTLGLVDDPEDYQPPSITITSPLDFLAVTDHAETFGEARLCSMPGNDAYGALVCRIYRGDVRLPVEDSLQPLIRLASQAVFGQDRSARICGADGSRCREEARRGWEANQRSAEAWLDRSSDCSFTTLHAYEYSLAEEASNLHRNVIFKSASVPQMAVSAKDVRKPEQLWRWMREGCGAPGNDCDVLAIPHNSNWSNGRMWFPISNLELSQDDKVSLAGLRQWAEPLVEMMQVKGDSECRNGIASVYGSPDEFCDFEKLRPASETIEDCGEDVGSGGMMLKGCTSRYSFVRYALTAGLRERQQLGTNPFALGIVAATDTHNSTPTAGREKGHLGSHGMDREAQQRLQGEREVPGGIATGSPVRYNPGGIAGVYAAENSRNALFEAMRQRETFGTSGPRITPRFFAGWELDENLCQAPDALLQAYAKGVPMGGELVPAEGSAGSAPVFFASAQGDARDGANLLQRIQVIKGWVDAEGRTQQAVYDVAGDPDNGASVDRSNCAVSGDGYRQLCTTWQDPAFDPEVAAVYYLRVLENPSCRWSWHDCLALPEAERPPSCSDPELPWQIQERAWTSPIWYYPTQAL